MKKTTFNLQVNCTVGFDDDEEIGEIEVDVFHDVLEIVSCLRRGDRKSEVYADVKSRIKVPSGGEVFTIGQVEGIVARLKSDDGIMVELELSDNAGVHSSYKVDGEKYESGYKERMREAKKLATQIMRL